VILDFINVFQCALPYLLLVHY